MSLTEILQLERQLTLFDLETTGTDPQTARIVQFGMFVYYPGEPEPVRYHTLVEPDVDIPVEASNAHGITRAILEHGCAKCRAPKEVHPIDECTEWKPIPRWADLAPRIHKGFSESDFAGYNIRYDLQVIAAEMERCGLQFDYSTAYIVDALRLWHILEPRTLSDAVQHFTKQAHVGAHGAIEDVVGTELVLIQQFTSHARSEILPRTLKELHTLCFPRNPEWIDSEGKFMWIAGKACFNFGKHKGRPVHAETGYLRWMLNGGFSVEVKTLINEWLAGNWPKQGELPL
jgi:DNA polymerase-3 subunit epsilon